MPCSLCSALLVFTGQLSRCHIWLSCRFGAQVYFQLDGMRKLDTLGKLTLQKNLAWTLLRLGLSWIFKIGLIRKRKWALFSRSRTRKIGGKKGQYRTPPDSLTIHPGPDTVMKAASDNPVMSSEQKPFNEKCLASPYRVWPSFLSLI